MKKIKFAGIAAAAVLAVNMLSGCGAKTEQTVSTDGSTSMERVIGFLSEAYMEKNPNVKVDVQSHRLGRGNSGCTGKLLRHRSFKPRP